MYKFESQFLHLETKGPHCSYLLGQLLWLPARMASVSREAFNLLAKAPDAEWGVFDLGDSHRFDLDLECLLCSSVYEHKHTCTYVWFEYTCMNMEAKGQYSSSTTFYFFFETAFFSWVLGTWIQVLMLYHQSPFCTVSLLLHLIRLPLAKLAGSLGFLLLEIQLCFMMKRLGCGTGALAKALWWYVCYQLSVRGHSV